MGQLIFLLGDLVVLVGGVMLLIEAFKKSVLWGILSLCVPFAGLVFVFLHWSNEKVRKAFFIVLGGVVVMGAGAVLGGASMLMRRGG